MNLGESVTNLSATDVLSVRSADRGDTSPDAAVVLNDLVITLASLDALAEMTTARRFTDVRRHGIDGGFVQQHVLNLDWGSGSGALPGCIVVQLRDGLISRIDEYLDGATIASFGS